jgi:hypothetical protein
LPPDLPARTHPDAGIRSLAWVSSLTVDEEKVLHTDKDTREPHAPTQQTRTALQRVGAASVAQVTALATDPPATPPPPQHARLGRC